MARTDIQIEKMTSNTEDNDYNLDTESLVIVKVEDLTELDRQLAAERAKFIAQVETTAMKLALSLSIKDMKLQILNSDNHFPDYSEDIHTMWENKQKTIDVFKEKVLTIEKNIYSHATQFVPFTLEKTKRQAKNDALASYRILTEVIENENYKFDPKAKKFLTIHDKAFRNFIIYLVSGIAAVLAAAALVAVIPIVFAVMGVTFPLSAQFVAITKLSVLGLAVLTGLVVGGAINLFCHAGDSYRNHRNRDKFAKSSIETTHRFFHDDAKHLLGEVKTEKTATVSLANTGPLLLEGTTEPEPENRPRSRNV